jgi:hypothetical protein
VSANTVERAYQLAASGECVSLTEIRDRLKAEGCDQITGHLSGRAIQKALRDLVERARL